MTLEIKKNVFNSVYYPYLTDYTHKFEIYYGGSGSGKSHFIAQKIIIKAINKKRKILIIRKTLASQRESCWSLVLDVLSKWKILSLCKINKTEYTIKFPNGSVLLFKGLDDSEKIKSITGITDCWVEETTELSEDDFDQLTLRVRERLDDIQFFCSFNPVSKANFCYKRWFADDAVKNDNTLIIHTTYKDNKFLPNNYIVELEEKIKTNPTYYRIYALGEFCSLDKLIFNNVSQSDFNPQDIDGKLCIGLDFGFVNDPTALVASIINTTNKEIYIFKNWTATNKTNDEIAKAITSLGFSKSVIIADSAEQKSIEEIKRLGITRIRPSVKGPDSVIFGIQKLQQYKIYVHPSCTDIIEELENYSWKKDKHTGEYINEPVDCYNHSIDALRYSLQALDINKLQTMNKSTFNF